MNTYDITGKIYLSVYTSVEANSEEEAIRKAKRRFSDAYRLDTLGVYHDPETDVDYDLDADKIPNEEN